MISLEEKDRNRDGIRDSKLLYKPNGVSESHLLHSH
jgi:hypothetical protein